MEEELKGSQIIMIFLSFFIFLLLGFGIYYFYSEKSNGVEKFNVQEEKIVYQSLDGKNSLTLLNDQEAHYNNTKFIIDEVQDSEKYAVYIGYYDGVIEGIMPPSFLVDKEKQIIIDGPQGDYGRGFIIIKNHYFFYDGRPSCDMLYTTSWQELGLVNSYKDVEFDDDGIYVYKDINDIGSKIKYDFNGDLIG